jgi:dTDP-4-amino-4,6-dideoxygalactose transaminase
MIPFTDLHAQYLEAKEGIDAAIARVLDTSSYITGPMVEEFEAAFAEYVRAPAACATGSGTTALMCALMACDIGRGDEVITTPHTFISTSEAIYWQGAKPVFVDIDEYYQIDVDKIEAAITRRTRAILFVDMYGQTPDIDRLRAIATKHKLFLIADAAHSIGAEYKGRKVGSLVDLTCHSFNPVKNLGAIGDAGAITGRLDLIARAMMHRDHGRTVRWDFDLKGINARIDNLQALVVKAKLPYLETWLGKKRDICERYTRELAPYVKTPRTAPWAKHSYYVYVIEVPERDEFIDFMKNNGVTVNVHYKRALTEQLIFEEYKGECPVAEAACRNIVSLPCYHTLSWDNQTTVINLVKQWAELHGN